MRRADREGHCVAFVDGGEYLFPRDHYEPLRAAWMRGEAFYTGTTHFGAPLTIKLARVEGVADHSPDVCQQIIAEDDEDRRERAIRGDE